MEPIRYPQARNMSAGRNGYRPGVRNAEGCSPCQNQMRQPAGPVSAPTMPCRDRFNDDQEDFPIGMAYVPWQKWENLYTPEQGLCEGTIFMDLNQIFCGKRGNRA